MTALRPSDAGQDPMILITVTVKPTSWPVDGPVDHRAGGRARQKQQPADDPMRSHQDRGRLHPPQQAAPGRPLISAARKKVSLLMHRCLQQQRIEEALRVSGSVSSRQRLLLAAAPQAAAAAAASFMFTAANLQQHSTHVMDQMRSSNSSLKEQRTASAAELGSRWSGGRYVSQSTLESLLVA